MGPVALDIARSINDSVSEEYANTVVIIAVVSILLTSPIGAIFIMELGPRLLHKTENDKNDGYDNPVIDDVEHTSTERL